MDHKRSMKEEAIQEEMRAKEYNPLLNKRKGQKDSLIVRMETSDGKKIEFDWYALKREDRRRMKQRNPKIVKMIEEAIKTGDGITIEEPVK
jgi:hypothetical protein